MSRDLERARRAELRRQRLLEQAEGVGWASGKVGHDAPPPVGRTVQERLVMVAEASRIGWLLTGRPFPSYSRETMPGVVLRKVR